MRLEVRLVQLGGHARPAAQVPGRGEAADIADLGHEDGRLYRHPVQGLDGPVATVVRQLVVDLPLDHGDLAVEDLQEAAQRLDPQR